MNVDAERDDERTVEELTAAVAEASRALFAVGQIDVRGHASARIPGTGRIVILGHLHTDHRLASEVTAADVLEVDLENRYDHSRLEPPNEVHIHLAIYRHRPDVGGVVHVHPEFATALSMSGRSIEPVSQLGASFEGGVPLFPDPWSISNRERGESLAATLGSRSAVLMQGHGATVVGATVEEASARALVLEQAARLQLIASLGGQPQPFDLKRDAALYARWLKAMRSEYYPTAWTLLRDRLRKPDMPDGR